MTPLNLGTLAPDFTLAGTGTVTGVTVTGNGNATSANVSGFRIYKKVGTNLTAYETGDLQIGSGVPNGTTPVSVTLTTAQGKPLDLSYWDLWFALVAVRTHDGDWSS